MKVSLLLVVMPLFLGLFPKPQDSPVTSTPFHQAYLEIPDVARAAQTTRLDGGMISFLLNKKTPIDQKAALVNALGWDQEGTPNFDAFSAALKAKRKINVLSPDSKMTAHDQLLLGYLLLLEDYFHPDRALPYLEGAAKRLPFSQTAQVLLAICRAQISFDSSWCEVWRHFERVEQRTDLQADLRPAALAIIREYLILYQPECG